jgi:hypothetical protein
MFALAILFLRAYARQTGADWVPKMPLRPGHNQCGQYGARIAVTLPLSSPSFLQHDA